MITAYLPCLTFMSCYFWGLSLDLKDAALSSCSSDLFDCPLSSSLLWVPLPMIQTQRQGGTHQRSFLTFLVISNHNSRVNYSDPLLTIQTRMSWCWFFIPSTFLPFLDLFLLLSRFRLHLELITSVLPLYNQIMVFLFLNTFYYQVGAKVIAILNC